MAATLAISPPTRTETVRPPELFFEYGTNDQYSLRNFSQEIARKRMPPSLSRMAEKPAFGGNRRPFVELPRHGGRRSAVLRPAFPNGSLGRGVSAPGTPAYTTLRLNPKGDIQWRNVINPETRWRSDDFPTGDYAQQYQNQGDDQQNVDETADGIGGNESQQPQYEKNDGKCIQHF